MKTKHIIIGLAILLVILFIVQKKEHAGSTPPTTPNLSNEAVQNIAKIYADTNNEAVFNNVKITGKLNILPAGTIVAFNSATAPAGWALCDGTNGTPDLRGRFIMGVGKVTGANLNNTNTVFGAKSYEKEYTFNITETGGENRHTLSVDEIPSHNHSYTVPGYNNNGANTWESTQDRNTNGMYTRNTGNIGGGKPHDNVPPYYALTYIMKT